MLCEGKMLGALCPLKLLISLAEKQNQKEVSAVHLPDIKPEDTLSSVKSV